MRHLFVPLALLALLPALLALPPAGQPSTAAELAQSNARVPILAINTGLQMNEGGTITVTSATLQLVDQDSTADQLTYRITRLPANGVLRREGLALAQGATFTQADINAGRLVYTHDGTEAGGDSFAFVAADGPRPLVQRVSLSSTGQQGNGDSSSPALSADGRYVAFASAASNLVSGDTNSATDIFVHDRATGQTSRVSISSGSQQGNGSSIEPALSADGEVVAFSSSASNLVPGDTNNNSDVFVHDRASDQTSRVSVSSTGTQGQGGSTNPALSADGRIVAFEADASNANLVPGDTNGELDIMAHDRVSGLTTRVSVNSSNQQSNGFSLNPALSGAGKYVAFESGADNLVANDTNIDGDVFVRDRFSGQTERVSVSSSGGQGNRFSAFPSLSDDGQIVAFFSFASNLVADDTNDDADVFVHDRTSGRTERVSVSSSGDQGNGDSNFADLSGNGRYVAFSSSANNLVPDDSNNEIDVLVRDRLTGQTSRVSVSSGGAQSEGGRSVNPALSEAGTIVAYESDATNLVAGDTNGDSDIFVYDQGLAGEVTISLSSDNDPPEVSLFDDVTLIRDSEPITIPFAIDDAESGSSGLNVGIGTTNPDLFAGSGPQIGGQDGNRSLTFAPSAGSTGSAIVSVNVGDGLSSTTREFTVTVIDPPSSSQPTWLALLYFAADDLPPDQPAAAGLTPPALDALSRLEIMPYNPDVRIIALFDGDAADDSLLLIREADAWVAPSTPPFWFSDELDSGAVATLRSFTAWGRRQFPGAEYTFLAVVDHGGGWAPDEGSVGQPRGRQMAAAGGWTGVSLDASARNGGGSSLSTRETGEIFAGAEPIDVLFYDACLMGMLESAYEIQPFVDYFVAGQSILWSQLPYEHYLDAANLNATTTPAQFAEQLVNGYNPDGPSDEPYALAAWNLQQLAGDTGLAARLNDLADALLAAYTADPTATEAAIRNAYAASQKFDYDANFVQDPTDGYIDLADFAEKLASNSSLDASLRLAATAVEISVDTTILASKTVEGTPRGAVDPWLFGGARGVAIYAPLGERDCRPSGRPLSSGADLAIAPCVAPANAAAGALQIEPQLPYYANPNQLRFSRDAPAWPELLLQLDSGTPNRDPSRQGPATPNQGRTGARVFLPQVTQ